MIIIKRNQIIGDISDHIARLEALVVDLERFTNGDLPSQAQLDDAPLLSHYGLTSRPAYCLAGSNFGHPIIQGRIIRTSELHVLAPELGWARTYSRLYRLGQPYQQATQDRSKLGDLL